jgi:alpha-beta hydrolase superfamily lysophospholipase
MKPCYFQFTRADGLAIACARWDARGPIQGIVQIAHGLGEHLGRYAELAEHLTGAGLVVYGNDHRGHGRMAGAAKAFGSFGRGGFDAVVEDMEQLTKIARVENPGAKVILLGHSMGSFAAQQYVLDHSERIDGLALSGSGVLDGLARLVVASGLAPEKFLNAAFEPARTPSDWLCRDPAVVDAFLKDALCFRWLQPAANESFLASAGKLSDPVRLGRIRHDLPIYLFSGDMDPVGQQLKGVSQLAVRYRAAGISDICFDFYAGGRHEMLNEINRDEVRVRLHRWIASVIRQACALDYAADNRIPAGKRNSRATSRLVAGVANTGSA